MTSQLLDFERRRPYRVVALEPREHLREAQRHASEASYGDAATFAEAAETYAQKAIDVIQAAKRGEGQK